LWFNTRKAPLTEEEEALQSIKQAEAEVSVGTSSRSSHTSSGINFPLTNEALQALKGLEGGRDNLVQLVRGLLGIRFLVFPSSSDCPVET
jgi:twinfilin-like protein